MGWGGRRSGRSGSTNWSRGGRVYVHVQCYVQSVSVQNKSLVLYLASIVCILFWYGNHCTQL